MTTERTSQPDRVVVVGGGLAGGKAVTELRDRGYQGEVTLVTAENLLPYERPPLSKGYLQGKAERDTVFVHDAQWYADHDVTVVLGDPATAVDRDAREVSLVSGRTAGYDRLLLATGSTPRTLDVPGSDAEGVLYLRTLPDSDALKAALSAGGRVCVVGGGWIGLETAAAARGYGCDVTVLEVDTLPLRRVLGDEIAAVFADLHRANGVDLRLGTGVREIGLSDGRVRTVMTAAGEQVPADVVVVGVGVRPLTDLASAAGIEVGDGIPVDARLRTSDPAVFAAGDVAAVHLPFFDRHVRVEHWAQALNSGPAAARSMLGDDTPYDRLPYFFTDQFDLGMEYTGWVEPGHDHRVVVRGNLDGREFIAFWLREGCVVAGMNVNVWDVVDDVQALIRSRAVVDQARLADPGVPLGDLATG